MDGRSKILVVEDDLSILTGVSMNLKFEGFDVLQAQDGRRGLELAVNEAPDLIILDVMLPKMNGFEVLKEIRGRGLPVPVVMLSAKGMEQDKVLGLQLGADDYVAKPFGLQELLARIRAVLRRRVREVESVSFGDCEVDLRAKSVKRSGAAVDLTAQEFRLLALLVENEGRTFTRDELLRGAWGMDYEGTERTIDNFMRQLRQKLEKDPGEPKHFLTARGLGYRFEK